MSLVAPERSLTETLDMCTRLGYAGDSERALAIAWDVLAKARALGERAAVACASQHIAWFCAQLGRAAEGLDPIHEAGRIWAEVENQAELARAGATYSWLLMELGDTEEAVGESAEALLQAEHAGDDAVLALACNMQGLALIHCGQLDSAAPLIRRAVALGRKAGDPHALSRWLINMGFLSACLGDRCKDNGEMAGFAAAYEKAIWHTREGIELARANASSWCLRIGLANIAEYHAYLEDIATAEAYLAEWHEVSGAAGDRTYIHYYYTQCEIFIRQGRFEEARAICELAVERAATANITQHQMNALRRMAEVLEAMEDFAGALDYFKRFHAVYRRFSGEMAQRRARLADMRTEIEKLKSLAAQANERADQMALEALIDPLTGIGNRRKFDRELARISAGNGSYAVAIVDLDHFKVVNDTYSHLVGDEVLRLVAETLSQSCRKRESLVARLGGEEFALLLVNVTPEVAEIVCRRVQEALAAAPWSELADGLTVTASIGLATSGEGITAREIVSLADGRLYAAKAAGRDCVVGGSAGIHPHTH